MSVLGRVILSSGERVDLADALVIDSYTAGDFQNLLKGFVGSNTPYILNGFDVIQPQNAVGTQSCSINAASAAVFYPGSSAGPFYFGLPTSAPLIPILRQSAVNYVYLTLTTSNTAADTRAFWNPDSNGGVGSEFTQEVNTETVLVAQVGVSVGSFPTGSVPLAIITMGTVVITAIEDARPLLFRLGSGGISPNPYNTFSWPSLPNSSFERVEPPNTIMSGGVNPFQGADKNIQTLKQWMDAVMSKLKELGGTTYWYDDISTFSLVGSFLDSSATILQSTGLWTHSDTTPGLTSWSANINIEILPDTRTYTLEGPGSVQLQNGQVAYLNLTRNKPINVANSAVAFVNGQQYINAIGGSIGLFANLAIGDWIQSAGDNTQNFVQVVQFWSSVNASGSPTTAALAKSVSTSAPYIGATTNNVAVYDQGVYTAADIIVSNRNVAPLATAGGNFFWLAFRSDNIEDINGTFATFSGVLPGTSTAVLIMANNPGTVGNTVALVFSGSNSISVAIATWNAANPTNQASLSSGDGTQIPTAQTQILGNGSQGSIVSTDLTITISTNDGTKALVTSTIASNLAATQRVTISGTAHYNGIYQILEVLSPTTFYIPVVSVLPVPESGVASYATVTTSAANGFPTDSIIHITGTTNYGGAPTVSGTLSLTSGTGDATIAFSSYVDVGSTYTFTTTSANATAGATYSNNGQAFVVQDTIVSGTSLITVGNGLPYPISVIDATHFNIPVPQGTVVPPPVGSPNLATAATYGVLAASTVTNAGSTLINGNLGLYPGTSVTGFPPGSVTGVENIANAAAQQAEIDATAAYTYLQGLSGSATSITAALDGQTLTPGIYKESSGTFNLAASGTGTLTLNGAGLYVFIASSTLVTGAGGIPIINLTNGALASNVYWVVGSSATINSGHVGTFQGTILANTSITDTMGGIVNGRLIALTGAVTLSAATTVNVPISVVSTPTEVSGIATLAAIIVRTQQGAFTLYQGQSIPINGTFIQNITSIVDAIPDYALPPGYNTLGGTANYNGLATDTVAVRLSELTGMMADKAQDKTIKYLAEDLLLVSNTTSTGAGGVNKSGIDLGTLTLSPGLYYYTSTAQLTGTLILDAGGNPNAQWFFQIGSTLTTASASSVSIINGGTAGNVFWQVGSSATIGAGTTFQGNIFAQASITVNTGASVDGRLVAITGAVTLNDNAITVAPISPSIIATKVATATPYAVIANSTVTNIGGSIIIGNLGLSPGTSVTGFPPGTISGAENVANPAAAQAQVDASTTYTYLATLTNAVGANQQITFNAGAMLTILQPGSPGNAVITLPSTSPGISLGVNQCAYVHINRNAATTPSISVANTSAVPLDENVFVIAERLTSTDIFLWDGHDFAIGTGTFGGSGAGITQVNLYDPVDSTLPIGSVTIDGVAVSANMLVMFSNLGSGNNEIYQANGAGTSITGWTAQYTFNGNQSPSAGSLVIVTQGNNYSNQIGEFNGTTWMFNNAVRYFNGTDYWEQSALITSALADNTTNGIIFTVTYLGSENMIVDYSIVRGPNFKETGSLYITTDGVNVSVAEGGAALNGISGVSFSGVISGSNIILQYTTTSTGYAATMKYTVKRWSDSAGGPGGVPSYSGGGGGSGVSSINTLFGAVTIAAGTNISIVPTGNTLTINASGGATAAGPSNSIQYNNGGVFGGVAGVEIDTTNNGLNLNGLNVVGLSSGLTITDNVPTAATLFTFPAATWPFAIIEYSIVRNGIHRIGTFMVTNDTVITSGGDDFFETTATGVVLTATISGSNVAIQYTSTSTGFTGTLKYSMRRWS